jgi:hypothetical protein
VSIVIKHQTLPAPVNLDPFDVILGRGRAYLLHPGNTRMQTLVSDNLARYQSAIMRIEKARITKEIVQTIKTCGDQPSRFLGYDARAGRWTEVDRVKVGAALRYQHKANNAYAVSELVTFPAEEPSPEPASKNDRFAVTISIWGQRSFFRQGNPCRKQ